MDENPRYEISNSGVAEGNGGQDMILTTDELKRVVDQLEDGKYIMIGTDDRYGDDKIIEKVIKKSSHKDNESKNWYKF